MAQIVGTLRTLECVSCQSQHGPWAHCVTVTGVPGLQSCANCHFLGQGQRCVFEPALPRPPRQPLRDDIDIALDQHSFHQAENQRRSHHDHDHTNNRMIDIDIDEDELRQAREMINTAIQADIRRDLAVPLAREEMRAALNSAHALDDYIAQVREGHPHNTHLRGVSEKLGSLIADLESLSIHLNMILEGTRHADGTEIPLHQAYRDASNSLLRMIDRVVARRRGYET